MKVKVIDKNLDDLQDKVFRPVGSVFECDKERAEYLINNGAVEIVEEVKEEKKYSFVIAEKLDDENITPLSTKEELDKLGDKIKEYVVEKPKSIKKKKSNKK